MRNKGGANDPDVAVHFRAHGYRRVLAWVHQTEINLSARYIPDWHGQKGDHAEAGKDKEKSSEARRKAKQRKRDLADGWKEHTIKSGPDEAVRELLVTIGREIKDNYPLRAALWIAIESPDVVWIGQHLCGLQGFKRHLLKLILGGAFFSIGSHSNHESNLH